MIESDLKNDPFEDAHFSASYLELMLNNIHRGNMHPDDIDSASAVLRHISDMHPEFWIVTFTGNEGEVFVPISTKDASVTVDRKADALSFRVSLVDTAEELVVDSNGEFATIKVLPVEFYGGYLPKPFSATTKGIDVPINALPDYGGTLDPHQVRTLLLVEILPGLVDPELTKSILQENIDKLEEIAPLRRTRTNNPSGKGSWRTLLGVTKSSIVTEAYSAIDPLILEETSKHLERIRARVDGEA